MKFALKHANNNFSTFHKKRIFNKKFPDRDSDRNALAIAANHNLPLRAYGREEDSAKTG